MTNWTRSNCAIWFSLRGGAAADKLEIARRDHEIAFKQAAIDKLTHEMAVLKRLKFAAKSEAFNVEQKSLLEETIDADLAAMERELEQLVTVPSAQHEKQQPKRQALPAQLPRREIRHEPESTTCACGCTLQRIGEDVAEKLDYKPGVFSVERHVRGKWVTALLQSDRAAMCVMPVWWRRMNTRYSARSVALMPPSESSLFSSVRFQKS